MKTGNRGQFIEIVSTRKPRKRKPHEQLRKLLRNPPLLVDVKTAQALLGLGRSTIFEMMRRGDLVRTKQGRATRITMESVLKRAGMS